MRKENMKKEDVKPDNLSGIQIKHESEEPELADHPMSATNAPRTPALRVELGDPRAPRKSSQPGQFHTAK
jgi:hypothetical protein